MKVDQSDLVLYGTPSSWENQTYNVTIQYFDLSTNTHTTSFLVDVVTRSNHLPRLVNSTLITNQTVHTGQLYEYYIPIDNFRDDDADPITISISLKNNASQKYEDPRAICDWITVSSNPLALYGRVPEAVTGKLYEFQILYTDLIGANQSANFSLRVTNAEPYF